jgi:tetratricopeptide (TPR) repeat protein
MVDASTPAGGGPPESNRAGPAAGAPGLVPSQLPRDIPGFTGRQEELSQLAAVFHEAGPAGATVPVAVISGMAGLGKTSLAVHFAHQVAGRFPGGQLYVNLRGFDPSGNPATPSEAIRGFLAAFAVPPKRVPPDLDGQAALLRSVLAGRRVLIVADNARDAEQVRPLLPGRPGCLVLITSRSQLTGVLAADAARLITPGLLTPGEAHDLLSYRLGASRAAAEPGAVDDLVNQCDGLPLALAVAAARAAGSPRLKLSALAAEMRQARGRRLDALDTGHPGTAVRTVFSWSYQQLSVPAARVFRLLGSHPGPDVSLAAVLSIAALDAGPARRALAELLRAQVLAEPVPRRYACHDLLRSYARDLADTEDTGAEHSAALHRLLDFYLHTACSAAYLLTPTRRAVNLAPLQTGTVPVQPRTPAQAQAWLDAERPVLLGCVSLAAEGGFPAHAWQLAWALGEYLDRRGDWEDWLAILQTALVAATAAEDQTGRARTYHRLGSVSVRLGAQAEALWYLREALRLYRELEDQIGQAHAHNTLCMLLEQEQDYRGALAHARRALELHREAGYRPGQANALNSIGWMEAHLGRWEQALRHCQQALRLHQGSDNEPAIAGTWDSLGFIHLGRGHHHQALTAYGQAVDRYQALGDRYAQAGALVGLGDSHYARHDEQAARDAWQAALSLLSSLRHPDARDVVARLARPRRPAPADPPGSLADPEGQPG